MFPLGIPWNSRGIPLSRLCDLWKFSYHRGPRGSLLSLGDVGDPRFSCTIAVSGWNVCSCTMLYLRFVVEILWMKDWSQGLKNTVVENTVYINLGSFGN